jgi:hypothetical protein
MFCGCPVRGEQNGLKIFYYWGNYLIAPVIIWFGSTFGGKLKKAAHTTRYMPPSF